MIKSKFINAIVAVAVIFALIAALLMVSFSSHQAVETSVVQPYESALFGGDLISIDIIADQEEWENMIANASQEEYIMVDVVVNGTKFQNVGIRPKGNSSLSQVAMSSSSNRYSFRLKFDQYVKGQTCFGLDTFVVNNMLGDNSYMKEYLSYDLMQYIGVDTPLYDFADISVNGEKWGFYLAIEAYDDSYMTRVYGDASGSLYNVKSMDMGNRDDNGNGMVPQRPGNGQMPTMPGNGQMPEMPENWQMPEMPENWQMPEMPENWQMPIMPGNGQMPTMPGNGQMPTMPENGQIPEMTEDDQSNAMGGMGRGMFGGMSGRGGGDLRYTDDNTSSYTSIFNNAIGEVTEESKKNVIEALKNLAEGTNLETYFDVDKIIRYMAAHTIVVNMDSYSSNMAQNYYIYEDNGKVTILPWDYNYAFGGFMSGGASSVVNFPIDTPVSGVSLEDRPLFAQLLANDTYKAKYHEYLNELMTGYFTEGKWAERLTQLDTLISGYVENDPSKFCTFEEYQKAVSALKTLGELRAESILGQLEGSVPSTTEAQNQNPDALISTDKLTMSDLGGSGMGGGNRGEGGRWGGESNTQGMPAGGFGGMGQIPNRGMGQIPDRGMGKDRGEAMAENARPDKFSEGSGFSQPSNMSSNSFPILLAGSMMLLIGAIIFAAKFKKRY